MNISPKTIRIIVVAFLVLVIGLLGWLLFRWVFGPHYKAVEATAIKEVDSFSGPHSGTGYYIKNSQLYQQTIDKNDAKKLTSRTVTLTELSPDKTQLMYVFASSNEATSRSVAVKNLENGTEYTVGGATGLAWTEPTLFYLPLSSLIAGSMVDKSGQQVLPTRAYNIFSAFGSTRFTYNLAEGSTTRDLRVVELKTKKELGILPIINYKAGPAFFGEYLGYLNNNQELVIFDQLLKAKRVSVQTNLNSLTQNSGKDQYFVRPKATKDQYLGEIYYLNLESGQTQLINTADFSSIYNQLRGQNKTLQISQTFYDPTTDTIYVMIERSLYKIQKVHSQ